MVYRQTLTAKNETVYLTLLDMSKAFDTIRRKTLIEFLRNTINADELHIIKKMLEVSLSVRCGNTIGEIFVTDTGAPQGDCASANEFTFYLAKSLGDSTPSILDHHYIQQNIQENEIPTILQEHNYFEFTQKAQITIEMEYADDMSEITSDYHRSVKTETTKVKKLTDKGLQINDSKTERYKIDRQNNDWKKCKLLGSLLDTEQDMQRRKSLAINAANNLNVFFKNDRLTIATKMNLIDTYIEPIFLYNSEKWATTKKQEESIDTFQRTLIRKYVLQIKWSEKISNEQLYLKTSAESWRKKVIQAIKMVRKNCDPTGHRTRKESPDVQPFPIQETNWQTENNMDRQHQGRPP